MLLPKNKDRVAILARQRHRAALSNTEILRAIQHSVVIPANRREVAYIGSIDTKIMVTPNDTVAEIFAVPKDKDIAVLNFGSYKNPGGQYLLGSVAQEEFLCHHSNLYEVLCGHQAVWYEPHQKTLNRGMYTGDAIWSERITFFNYTDPAQVAAGADSEIEHRQVGVLTMAAPNRKVAIEYQNVDVDQYNQVLFDRLYRVLQNMYTCNPKGVIILGAFGCGVFRNDPVLIARYFKNIIDNYFINVFDEIRFAVPIDNTNHYQIFVETFKEG